MDINQIKVRAEAVNLSLKKLARRSGADHSKFYRAARLGTDNRARSLRALADSLVAEELRQRDRLLALHPLATEQAPAREIAA